MTRPSNLRDEIVSTVERYFSLTPRLYSIDHAAEANRTPIQWWDVNQYEYPYMYQLAVTLTAITATTASVESLFSTLLRRQRDYTEARMASETLRMRAFVSYNYSIVQRYAAMRAAAQRSDYVPILDQQDRTKFLIFLNSTLDKVRLARLRTTNYQRGRSKSALHNGFL